jgi:hypothetical protein
MIPDSKIDNIINNGSPDDNFRESTRTRAVRAPAPAE